MKTLNTTLTAVAFAASAGVVQADILHLDDVISTFSHCIGNDCVNGESFGFDTVRLKENNLRIHFGDTSNNSSFPRNDWRIRINDSSNGGGSYFAVEDATTGRTPFRVDAGAIANALYVDSQGDVGIGTSTPVVELHAVDGNSPTLRLEQNGTSGFTPQTWDLAGNEANFFVRDVTNGSTLPIRLRPGAPTSALDIASDGDIGIGTASPVSSLDVSRSDGTAEVSVVETNAINEARTLLQLTNNGSTKFGVVNSSTGLEWVLAHGNNSTFKISREDTTAAEMVVFAGGNVAIGGTLTQGSDVNSKTGIRRIDNQEILSKVSKLPVSSWSYKHAPGVKHIGPMAQDFHAAFGLGHTNKGIATIDATGIALAAIKALNEKLDEKDARIAALEQKLIGQERVQEPSRPF